MRGKCNLKESWHFCISLFSKSKGDIGSSLGSGGFLAVVMLVLIQVTLRKVVGLKLLSLLCYSFCFLRALSYLH